MIVNYDTVSFKVTRSKDVDLAKKQTSRTVFRCNVIGAPGSGRVSKQYQALVIVQLRINRKSSVECLEGQDKVAIVRSLRRTRCCFRWSLPPGSGCFPKQPDCSNAS